MDPITIAILGGLGVNALSSLFGAQSQSSANQANLQYMIAHNNMMQNAVGAMMQQGTNPYSQALMSFLGQGVPVRNDGLNWNAPLAPGTPGKYTPGTTGGGGAAPYGGAQSMLGAGTPNFNMAAAGASAAGGTGIPWQDNPGMTLGQLLGLINSGDPNAQKYLSGGNYGGQYQASYGSGFYGGTQLPVDINSLPLGTTLGDLVKNGTLTQDQAYKMFNYNPATDNPSYGATLLGTDLTGISPTDSQAWAAAQQAMTNQAQAANTAWMNNYNAMNAPDVSRYLQNGVLTNGNGQVLQQPGGSTLPVGSLSNTGGMGFTGQPQVGSYDGTNMYGYQPIQAATYNPTLLGGAPLFNAPTVSGISNVNAPQVSGLPTLTAPTIQAGQIGAPMTVGTPGFNTGQDALMQMLRSGPRVSTDPTADLALQNQASNPAMFQTSNAAKSLTDLANFNLQQQVDQLHASAGDLGKRFGTGMMNSEALLRQGANANLNATLAPLYQQSFESAQGRQLSAAGTLAQQAQQMNQLGAGIYGTQIGGAQALGGLGYQGASLAQQAQAINAGNQLQVGQANLGALMQAQQQNAGNALTAGQGNLQAILQSSLANAGNSLQAQQVNAANQLQMGGMNLNALMQAGLANQQMLGQYGMANANIANQVAQYNTGNLNAMAQFNAQQGNLYNQFMTGGINQAYGLQNSQNQYNAGLLSLLAGLPIPQQQVSPYPAAVGNLGSTLAMIPFMNQMMGGQQQSYNGPTNLLNNYTPGYYNFTPRPM